MHEIGVFVAGLDAYLQVGTLAMEAVQSRCQPFRGEGFHRAHAQVRGRLRHRAVECEIQLADFSRRSRVRALWFRLDRGDRDWVGFIAYLVAAIRIHVPDFAPVTQSLLRETGGSAPPRDAVLDTFIRELGG